MRSDTSLAVAADLITPPVSDRGRTPREVAAYLRCRVGRVLTWIRSGELGAVNTGQHLCGRPQYVVLPHHLAEFTRRRAGA